MAFTPSTDPVVEKAQHEPHCCWFFTALTAFFSLQSMDWGGDVAAYLKG